MTYPQTFVQELIDDYCVPIQVNNTLEENKSIELRFHHIWTPDLRILNGDAAISHYSDVLRRFPMALAAPEANYFLAVTNHRKTDEANALLHGWHDLEKTYPNSEWTVKQDFD